MRNKFSKIISLFTLSFFAFAMFFPLAKAETTIGLSPVKVSVNVGQSFKLTVAVNPHGIKNFTVSARINFPSSMVNVTAWSFAPVWQPLQQPGYDVKDNNNGLLVKTAGYGETGIDKTTTLGTATFVAKKAGTATISIDNASIAYDESSQNVYNNGIPAVIVIGEPTAAAKPTPTPTIVAPSVEFSYLATLYKDIITVQDPLAVIVKLSNKPYNQPVDIVLKNTIYDENGNILKTQENPVKIVTEADQVDKLDISNLPVGQYALVNELTYEGQIQPQKTVLMFTVKPGTLPITLNHTFLYWCLAVLFILIIILTLSIIAYKKRKKRMASVIRK